jgi:hypothetical protein
MRSPEGLLLVEVVVFVLKWLLVIGLINISITATARAVFAITHRCPFVDKIIIQLAYDI